MEQFNPSGSHKDRPGKLITSSLRQTGRFAPSGGKKPTFGVLSSFNFANAIAFYTVDDHGELVVVTDLLSSPESRAALRAYPHVRLKVVNKPDASGSHVHARRDWLARFQEKVPSTIFIDQYRDRRVPLAYETTLCREIDEQTDGYVGAIFVRLEPLASLTVFWYSLKHDRRWPSSRSMLRGLVCFGHPQRTSAQFPGYSNGDPQHWFKKSARRPYAFTVVHVDDHHAASVCHRLRGTTRSAARAVREATVAAVEQVVRLRPDLIPDSGRIVAIIPDGGTSTICRLCIPVHGCGPTASWVVPGRSPQGAPLCLRMNPLPFCPRTRASIKVGTTITKKKLTPPGGIVRRRSWNPRHCLS